MNVRWETLEPPPSSIPTTSFNHLDALRMGLVEHLHVVDLPDKVPGPQTAGLRYRFLSDLMITVEVTFEGKILCVMCDCVMVHCEIHKCVCVCVICDFVM